MIESIHDAFPGADPKWLDGLEREFRFGTEMEKVRYKARQLAARQSVGPQKTVEGLGQLTHVFDARTYFRWLEEDKHFWDDPNNVRRYERDNPECKVDAPEKKVMVMV